MLRLHEFAVYAWVFNLDADFELAEGRRYTTPKKLAHDLAPHVAAAARSLLGPNDRELTGNLENNRGQGPFFGRAWCPTDRALALMRRFRVEPEPHPEMSVLRRVNHRRFAMEVGGGLPGQRWITRREEIPDGPWLLKRPLAFAGRGQLRPGDRNREAWIEKSLAKDGLVCEPFVAPSFEVSVHGFIWRDGRFEIGRICEQVVERGVHKGAKLAGPFAEQHELLASAERTAKALGAAGYFGPFGIDGYRYEGGFCTLSEVNARYTMAFAIGFPTPAHKLALI